MYVVTSKSSETEKSKNISRIVTESMDTHKIGKNASIATVPIELLKIDNGYHRKPNPKQTCRLKRNFDTRVMQLITVSHRDGSLYIVDGCHRAIAASMNGMKNLPCILYGNLTKEDEARIYELHNMNHHELSTDDLFKVNLVLKEPMDTKISDICKEHGIDPTLPSFSVPGAKAIMEEVGPDCLKWVIRLMNRFETKDLDRNSYKIMYALKHVYKNGIRNDRLNEYERNLTCAYDEGKLSFNKIFGYGNLITDSKDVRTIFKTGLTAIAYGTYETNDFTS